MKPRCPRNVQPDDVAPCVTGRPSQEQIDNDTPHPAQRCHDAFLAAGPDRAVHQGSRRTQRSSGHSHRVHHPGELEAGAGCVATGGGSRMPMRDLIRAGIARLPLPGGLRRSRPRPCIWDVQTHRLCRSTDRPARPRPRLHQTRLHCSGLPLPGPPPRRRLDRRHTDRRR